MIINADDFGLSEGVNRAIKEAHSHGVLTSATIMANMPAAGEAVKIAGDTSSLGVGVHLNLTDGKSISQDGRVSVLLDSDGRFAWTASKLALKSIVSAKVREAIELELAAQISWVIDNGIKPTHLDSHKHIHSFGAIFSIVCKLAERFSIGAIRWTFEPKAVCSPPWPATDAAGKRRARIVRFMAKMNRRSNPTLLKSDALLGVAHTGRIDRNFFKAAAKYGDFGPAIEIMTHPGYAQGLDPAETRLLMERQVELKALCSQETKNSLEQAGVKLVHYGQI